MIGIDTNVLIRFIVRDDEAQTSAAAALIDSLTPENPGFITLVSIAELYWVLDHSYKSTRDEIYTVFQSLLTSKEIIVEDAAIVHAALHLYSATNADFDDCLIAGCSRAAGCDLVLTFDKKAAKAIGMTLLPQTDI
jgi:predicted nucleic-acid-binding protein